ncbi:MAG: hypothetical protein K5924_04135 [Chloroflexi bacterium]|nr:hypothetical protein [Chloroflexota bacterium]
MADAGVQLRIRVIVGSTRAALRSLPPGDAQVPQVLNRGRELLDALQSETDGVSTERQRAFDAARAEIDAMAERRT